MTSLQVAMKKKSIRVNCLCPAFVETPMLEQQKAEPQAAAVINHFGAITLVIISYHSFIVMMMICQ